MKIYSNQPNRGFTLVEVMIVILISSVLLGAVLSAYITYINAASKEMAQDKLNAEVNSVFKILERDMMMAGYAFPLNTRVASNDNCSVGDEAFCKAGTDRLFLANGWEILTDVTPNHEDDEQVHSDYLTLLADTKNSTVGGYRGLLAVDANSGAASITLVNLNINNGEENTASPPYDNDFKYDTALIIGDTTKVEGHRIIPSPSPPSTTITGTTISLLNHDHLAQNYMQSAVPAPSVVPAAAWYIRSDPDGKRYPDGSTIYWLYKNNYRVMEYVDNFQIQYGYDVNNNGIQWADTFPPPSARLRPMTQPSPDNNEDPWIDDGWVPTPDGQTFEFSHLKVIKLIVTVKSEDKGIIQRTPYQRIVYLRN